MHFREWVYSHMLTNNKFDPYILNVKNIFSLGRLNVGSGCDNLIKNPIKSHFSLTLMYLNTKKYIPYTNSFNTITTNP